MARHEKFIDCFDRRENQIKEPLFVSVYRTSRTGNKTVRYFSEQDVNVFFLCYTQVKNSVLYTVDGAVITLKRKRDF